MDASWKHLESNDVFLGFPWRSREACGPSEAKSLTNTWCTRQFSKKVLKNVNTFEKIRIWAINDAQAREPPPYHLGKASRMEMCHLQTLQLFPSQDPFFYLYVWESPLLACSLLHCLKLARILSSISMYGNDPCLLVHSCIA